jgi:AcrR family transcriptional regulator
MARTGAVPSVWARPEQSEPDQPALSRDAIVRVAIELLDAEGIEALSMRKLGARLNAGATSLYRHVATKDELMELAVDEVFGEMRVPELAGAPGAWREAVAGAAAEFRATALRHPWLASVLGQAGLAYLGPRLMAFNEGLASLFADAGFAAPVPAIDAVLSFVIGMSTTEAAWLSTVARSGGTEAEFIAKLMPAAHRAAEGHEHLARNGRASVEDPAALRDAKFADGLAIVLDGLALRRPPQA